MKRVKSALFSAICALAFAACGQGECAAQAVTMTATVIEVRESGLLLVESGAGADSAMTVGARDLPIYDAQNHPIELNELRAGQQLELCYDGSRLETFPSQVPNCEYLKLTGEETDVSGLLEQLQEWLSTDEEDPLPNLQVECSGKKSASCLLPMRGTSIWQQDGYGVCQDSPHPLMWREEHLRSLETEKGSKELKLLFSRAPQQTTVTRWDASYLGDAAHITDGEAIEVSENGAIPLEKGNWLYEVTGSWEEGTVSWAFLVTSGR